MDVVRIIFSMSVLTDSMYLSALTPPAVISGYLIGTGIMASPFRSESKRRIRAGRFTIPITQTRYGALRKTIISA